LPDRGLLADSPGFNQPDLDCPPADLAKYFPEARERLAQENCQFSNCLHRDEPNCVVREDWERYQYYLKFLDEAIARQQIQQQQRDQESTLKLKIKDDGKHQYEPKLETKKYRRSSRRERQQNLQGNVSRYQTLEELYEEAED
jgi:ribosome biogenesis GTPase